MGNYWTDTSTSSCTWNVWVSTSSSTTVTLDNTWATWTSTTGTMTSQSNSTWVYWNEGHFQRERPVEVAHRMPTAEEVEQERQRQQVREAEMRQWQAERAVLQRDRDEAVARAEALLRSVLTTEQLAMFQAERAFVVEGRDGLRYRLMTHRHGNIEVIDRSGKVRERLCRHVADYEVPNYDNLVAQKLMLEADEYEFIRHANRMTYDVGQMRLPPMPAPAAMQ